MKDKCVGIEELSAYVDSGLEAGRAREVAAHLDRCADCRLIETHLLGLKSKLATYRDVAPKRDLWPEIDRRLGDERHSARAPTWRLARLAPIPIAAAAVLAVVLFRGPPEKTEPEQPANQAQSAQSTKPAPDLNTALATVEQAEMAYRDAIASLEKTLDREKENFDPETLAVIEKSLSEIEAAIERSREAMRKDPGNVEANRAMLAAYRQKMDFLFEVLGPKIRREGA